MRIEERKVLFISIDPNKRQTDRQTDNKYTNKRIQKIISLNK